MIYQTNKIEKKVLIIIFFLVLISFLLRVYIISGPTAFSGEERLHVASAFNYINKGYIGPDNWHHPPLKHILMYCSIELFGNNPYGWRLRNVFFGTLTIIPLFLLTLKLSENLITPIFASLLLSTDPLHILFSRTTFEDIPSVFFIFLALYIFFNYIERKRFIDLLLCSLFIGISVSLRLYWIPVLAVFMLVIVIESFKNRAKIHNFFINIMTLFFIPLNIYLLSYYPWFTKGYSLFEWLTIQIYAFREMMIVKEFHPILMELKSPYLWFFKFLGVSFNIGTNGTSGRYISVINNLPIWIFILPAMAVYLITSLKKRAKDKILICIIFALLYLSYLASPRPIFLYTALSIIPFGFIAIAHTSYNLLKKKVIFFIGPLILWSLFLYPLVIGIKVQNSLYKPILDLIKVFNHLP